MEKLQMDKHRIWFYVWAEQLQMVRLLDWSLYLLIQSLSHYCINDLQVIDWGVPFDAGVMGIDLIGIVLSLVDP